MLLDRDPPTNWHEILLDFLRWRWKLRAVAAAINVPPSTLKGWWYDGHEPGHSDGQALLKLHSLEKKKRESDQSAPKTSASSASRAHEPLRKEPTMAKTKRPGAVRTPGNAGRPGTEGGRSDPDAAIAAGRAGKAHKVEKPKKAVPASRIKGDPERPQTMPVNAKAEVSYADAMAQRNAGTLARSVLTDQGWVTPLPNPVPAGAKA